MKKLQLYNSLLNSLEDFVPIDADNVKMYACGPTVYSSPHIGNARPLVIFDTLFRLLQKLYGGKVTYVRNITDVDDKINARAKELSIPIKELTTAVTAEFHRNLAQLNVLDATHEPKATDHIPEMLDIIRRIIDGGFAYESAGQVLFRVKKMQQYGMLSKRNVDDMIAGSRVEVAPYKEDPMDFVLWKPSEDGTPSWNSPFGSGRPGWHIECSAMSHKYLGEKFDIHVGGQDLMFPHHENEIAQNFSVFGCIMANYWIHNGMLVVDGKKMSKSLGNIISLDDALKTYDGELIRYILLGSHYQKTLNWTEQAIHQAKQALDRLYGALQFADCNSDEKSEDDDDNCYQDDRVVEALCNNLNTPLALHHLHDISDEIYRSKTPKKVGELCALLKKNAKILGLLKKNHGDWFRQASEIISTDEIERLIAQRTAAKAEKKFELADEIRSKLLEKKIQIEDTKDGTKWKSLR
jgi:cysteinyl-tRNA synthetase